MSAITYNQPSWLHAQVQGGYPTIVHRKMSSFFDARGRRKKKITTYRSQSRGSFAPSSKTRFSVAPFITCFPTVRPSSVRRLVSHEDIYSSKSNTWSVQLADKLHGTRLERRTDLPRSKVSISIYLLFPLKPC